MKYNGTKVQIREYTTLKLERRNSPPLTLRINAIPLGMKRDFELMCPRPRPPFKMVMDKGTSRKEENYEDATYQSEFMDHRDLERYYVLFCAMKDNPELEFDNIPINVPTLRAFRQELKEAGFSEGDSKKILEAAMSASNISEEDVEKAKDSF